MNFKEEGGLHDMEGMVLEIQRMSTEDGPGIRTTLFLKGCPLRCAWCHNPESISMKPEVQWIQSLCIACFRCVDACPEHALINTGSCIEKDRGKCRSCGTCADVCPSGAMDLIGEKWTVDKLVRELAKDRSYFEESGGGVTLSGGEVTIQADFALEILKGLKAKGIHTAIDTCGFCKEDKLKKLLPYSDLVLFDLKAMDDKLHRELTGAHNEIILSNLKFISGYMKDHVHPREMWVRTPVIPGATSTVENIEAIGKFLSGIMSERLTRWDLCTFNNMCRDKYERLGISWIYRDSELLSRTEIETLVEAARNSLLNPSILKWSGPVRVDTTDPIKEIEHVSQRTC